MFKIILFLNILVVISEKNNIYPKYKITAEKFKLGKDKEINSHYINLKLVGHPKESIIKTMISFNNDKVLILGPEYSNGIDINRITDDKYKCEVNEEIIEVIYYGDVKIEGNKAYCYFDIRTKEEEKDIIVHVDNINKLEIIYITKKNEVLTHSLINFSNNSKFMDYLIQFFSLESLSYNFIYDKYDHETKTFELYINLENNISHHYLIADFPIKTIKDKSYWSLNNLNFDITYKDFSFSKKDLTICISSFNNGFLAIPKANRDKLCKIIFENYSSKDVKEEKIKISLNYNGKAKKVIVNLKDLGFISNKDGNNPIFECYIDDIADWGYTTCINENKGCIGVGKHFLSKYDFEFNYIPNENNKDNNKDNNNEIKIYNKKVEKDFLYLVYIISVLFIIAIIIVIFSYISDKRNKKYHKNINEVYEKIE